MRADARTASGLRRLATEWLTIGQPAVVVRVAGSQGSAPRDAGARMLVSADSVQGTVGGGHLEWQAIELARRALTEHAGRPNGQKTPPPALTAWTHRFALGPSLGQCCGGVVDVAFAPLNEAELAAWPEPPSAFHVELHGAGHVGQAIVRLLSGLDCTVRWIDTREQLDLPGMPSETDLARLPASIHWCPTDDARAEVAAAPPGALHLVLTHRHDLDLDIIDAVLRRADHRFAGLIGSATKRARFLHRLAERGVSEAQLGRLTCPIGVAGVAGKEPAVIAIAVVAQLLQVTSLPSTTP
jgi:xanthine dehydrogenase accessory factor